MIVAAMRSVSFSCRRTDPSPVLELPESIDTASSRLAPSGSFSFARCGRPNRCGTCRPSEALRDREVLLEIAASSSISITTVRISPRCIARRSPSSDCRLPLQREARSTRRFGSAVWGKPGYSIAACSSLSWASVMVGALPRWSDRAQAESNRSARKQRRKRPDKAILLLGNNDTAVRFGPALRPWCARSGSSPAPALRPRRARATGLR